MLLRFLEIYSYCTRRVRNYFTDYPRYNLLGMFFTPENLYDRDYFTKWKNRSSDATGLYDSRNNALLHLYAKMAWPITLTSSTLLKLIRGEHY